MKGPRRNAKYNTFDIFGKDIRMKYIDIFTREPTVPFETLPSGKIHV